MSPKINIIKR